MAASPIYTREGRSSLVKLILLRENRGEEIQWGMSGIGAQGSEALCSLSIPTREMEMIYLFVCVLFLSFFISPLYNDTVTNRFVRIW